MDQWSFVVDTVMDTSWYYFSFILNHSFYHFPTIYWIYIQLMIEVDGTCSKELVFPKWYDKITMCELFGFGRRSRNSIFRAMFPNPPKFRTNIWIAKEFMRQDIQTITIPHNWSAPEEMITGSAAEYSIDMSLADIGDIDSMSWDNKTFACFEEPNRIVSMYESLVLASIHDRNSFDSLNEIDKIFNSGDSIKRYTLAPCVISAIRAKEGVMFTENLIYKLKLDRRYPGYVNMEEHGIFRFTKATNIASDWAYEPYAHEIPIKMSTYDAAHYHFCPNPNIKSKNRGPSLKTYRTSKCDMFDRDNVLSTRCPFWPPNAGEWLTRRRKYGWPDQETISLVVDSGCFIIPVAHIDCSTDAYQWRISFSKAEIILIKRWTPKQQMVYHMLRYFAKTELIPTGWRNFDEILSTYSLKTLMLWQCERKSVEWWNSKGILKTCCGLVRILFSWLMNVDCRNYFIRESNLFAHRMNEGNYDIVLEKLSNFVSDARSIEWFKLNYYSKFFEKFRTSTVLDKSSERLIILAPPRLPVIPARFF